MSPSAGVIQYIKNFAKILEEGVDKGYLNECWQSNVQEDAVEKVCFFIKQNYAGIINRQLNCSSWNVNLFFSRMLLIDMELPTLKINLLAGILKKRCW